MATIGQALTSPESGWKRIESQNNTLFSLVGTWSNNSTFDIISTTNPSSITFYFYGTKVRLLTYNSSNRRSFNVYVDGVLDTSNISGQVGTSQNTLSYEKINLPLKTHKITIEYISNNTYSSLDAVDIDDTGYMTNSYMTKALIQATNGKILSFVPKNFTTLNPQMTSNTAPSGVASASSIVSGYDSWYAFDRGLSGTNSSSWQSANPSTTAWLQYKFNDKKTVRSYAITGTSTISTSPKNWTFEGSDDGLNYDILDTQSNIVFSTSEKKVFNITNIKPYLCYRLNISLSNGGAYISIAELEMFDTSSKIVYIDTADEFSFINNGMSPNTFIDLSDMPIKKSQLDKSPVTLGSGKVFKTTINTTNIPIKLVTIK